MILVQIPKPYSPTKPTIKFRDGRWCTDRWPGDGESYPLWFKALVFVADKNRRIADQKSWDETIAGLATGTESRGPV